MFKGQLQNSIHSAPKLYTKKTAILLPYKTYNTVAKTQTPCSHIGHFLS